MRATVNELRLAMFEIDFCLIVNQKGKMSQQMSNSKGRAFLYEIKDEDMELVFHVGPSGVFIIETEISTEI